MTSAVLFDLDDTLFDHSYCARTALDGVRAAHECLQALPAERIEEAHGRILDDLHGDVVSGKRELDAARIERFRRLFEFAGVQAEPALASAAAACYRQAYLESWRVVQGAIALLGELRRREIPIAVVSNNLLEEQQDKMRYCALEPYIDALVVSGEVAVSKPDPRIFHIALDRLGRTAAEAVMVGDSWTADIAGAAAAGIRPIWLNRRGERRPPEPAGVLELSSLEPAADVVDRILGIRQGRERARPR